jgi:hypothetical protein
MRELPNLKLFNAVAWRCDVELPGFYNDAGTSWKCDLDTAHIDIGLDFKKLLNCESADFVHDMRGIANNIDRYKLKVMNNFVPRCALPEEVA